MKYINKYKYLQIRNYCFIIIKNYPYFIVLAPSFYNAVKRLSINIKFIEEIYLIHLLKNLFISSSLDKIYQ